MVNNVIKKLSVLGSGKRSYSVAAAMVALGVSQYLGVDIPGFNPEQAGQLVVEGLLGGFIRNGIGKVGGHE